jgi:hypothetical protein
MSGVGRADVRHRPSSKGKGGLRVIDPVWPASEAGVTNELGATIDRNRAWLATLEEEDSAAIQGERSPNALPPLGIDGAGFFVLEDRGQRLFSRTGAFHVADDGRLLDERGRQVMGFVPGEPGAAPTALRVPSADVTAGRHERYEVDDDGTVYGAHRAAARRGDAPVDRRIELGKLCIAIFPAPDLLAPREGAQMATRFSGAATYAPADAPHVGALHRQPQQRPPEALRANLRELWSLSGRAEIDIAMAAGADALARIALNLVK